MPLDTARIDAIFAPWDRPDSPGVALGLVQGGELAYARGYGSANLEYGLPITPRSIFHVASVSKQFAAFCVVLLAQEGALSLDDEVRSLVPVVPDLGARITVRHLLAHTSGLRDQWDLLYLAGWREADLKTDDDVLALVARQRALNFAPGSEYVYSNTGFTLLGAIVRAVTGKSLRAFAHERIFAPLGMQATHFHDDHREVVPGRAYAYVQDVPAGPYRIEIPNFDTVGATSLFTTVEDLALWAANVRQPRVGAPVLEAMAAPAALADGTPLAYGFGLAVPPYRGLRTVGHDGADGGYRAKFIVYPDADLAVIVLANLGSIRPDALARQVVDVVLEDRLGPPPVTVPATPPGDDPVAAYAGTYGLAERGEFVRLEARDGALWAQTAGSETGEALRHIGPGRFSDPTGMLVCRFEPAPDGEPGPCLVVESPYGRARTLRPVAAWTPDEADAARLAGTYASDELDVRWRVEAVGTDLWLHRWKFAPERLRPLARDAFAGPEHVTILFDRDPDGQAGGLRACTGRAWRIAFGRVRDPG